MTITKIAVIVGASIVTAGGSAAVATRSKWLPKSEENKEEPRGNTSGQSTPPDTKLGQGTASGGEQQTGVRTA